MVDKNARKFGDFEVRKGKEAAELTRRVTHIYHGGARCETEPVGSSTPGERSPLDLVVDATQGFIPLWDYGVSLRWRFQEQSFQQFVDPEAAKSYVRGLLGEALLAWGDAVPVRFVESRQPWDFEVVVRDEDNCNVSGCTLARAFFPDGGQHELVIFPRMFQQVRQEQMETMAHELGHVFGLRHFFAKVSETAFPSEIFGEHQRFSIMNYGADSRLTEDDRADLKRLYQEVWSGRLEQVNGTPIRLMQPFSSVPRVMEPSLAAAFAPSLRRRPTA